MWWNLFFNKKYFKGEIHKDKKLSNDDCRWISRIFFKQNQSKPKKLKLSYPNNLYLIIFLKSFIVLNVLAIEKLDYTLVAKVPIPYIQIIN